MAGKSTAVISMDMGDYQTQDDLRALAKAEMIKKDPKRYKAAMKMAQDQIEALENVCGPDADDAKKD